MASECRITSTVTVAAPVDEVWGWISDTSRYEDWVEATEKLLHTDGPARVGSTYSERDVIAGPWKATVNWRVSEVDEAARRQVHHGEGIPTVRNLGIVMELDPKGEETTEFKFTVFYTPRFGPLGTLIDKAVAGTIKKEQDHSLSNFAELVARERSTKKAAPAAAEGSKVPG
ncbi:MAG TPA: SRPBCC family protein [Thermoleophilaceae bacterium]|jgi:uncharacterized membrane protein